MSIRLGHLMMHSLAVLTALTISGRAHAGGTFDKIRSTGTITLGYREASIPFSYLGGDQKPEGFSLEICSWIADRIKTELRLDALQVTYIAVNAANRIPLIQNGTIDIECGSTTNTLDRQKQVAFSVATFVSQPRWLTTITSGVNSAADLRGKTIVITQGSLNFLIAKDINAGDKVGFTIAPGKDHAESLLMLTTGRVSAFFEDDILLAGLKASAPDPRSLKLLPDNYKGFYYYGLMLRKDDPEFKSFVDSVLKEKMMSGAFTKAYDKWFTAAIPPQGRNLELPMSDALKERVANPSDHVDN
jgi:glutamate/aspartate transport system substrate-binding protein